MSVIESMESFEKILESEDAFVLYFNASTCNVGEALSPKVSKLLEDKYPKMKMLFVNKETTPDVAAQLSVFVLPTILVFFGGKESLRKSRHFSMKELEDAIQRPYDLLFG